jgi:hypothetical protein
MLNNLKDRLVRWFRRKPVEEKHRIKDRILAFQIGPFRWLASLPAAWFFGRNLRMLATIFFTDKWNWHWYAQHYEDIFRKDRRRKINLLEIGVGGDEDPTQGGGSLRMWRAYFPRSRVYGIDIFDKSLHNQRRIKTFRGSQADPLFLDQVVREIGKIDIIIDDGSHVNEHALFTFQRLFPHLADGGVYAIEDTQTSYWAEYGGNENDRNDPATTVGYFKSLVDGLNWEEFRGKYNPTDLDLNIRSIAFYHNLIVIRKGSNQEHERPPHWAS